MGLITAAAGLIAAAYAEAGARQSVTKIIEELQALVDAGVTDSELNKSIEELENMEGIRYLSSDRADALELLNNYNEVQGQALGAMQQLDELESVVAELEAAGVSSPELDAEIAEIQSMLETQLEGDTSEDYSKNITSTLIDRDRLNLALESLILKLESSGVEIKSMTNEIDSSINFNLGNNIPVKVNKIKINLIGKFETYQSIRSTFLKKIKNFSIIQENLSALPGTNFLNINLEISVIYNGKD